MQIKNSGEESSRLHQASPNGGHGGGWLSNIIVLLNDLVAGQKTLIRNLRRQRHAQDNFQETVSEQFCVILKELDQEVEKTGEPQLGDLSGAQIQGLTRLDQACEHLLHAGRSGRHAGDPSQPTTSDEAVAMLQVRVRHLQRSFGIEAITSVGASFDDRLHRANGVCERPDVGDGVVTEEILPGYTLHGRVIQPAVVVVNRWPRGKRENRIL